MIITAIRHTSVDVPSGICYGITDVSLAGTFGNEAAPIAECLRNQHFDAVFSSPMERCTKLARFIFPEMTFITDRRLTELNFGDWEMVPWETIFSVPEGKAWFQDYVHTSCPNGESFTGLISRVNLFLNELRTRKYEQIAVFTHSGVIRALMCLLWQNKPEDAFNEPIKYGQIIHFNN